MSRAPHALLTLLLPLTLAAQDPKSRAEQVQQARDEAFRLPVPNDSDIIERSISWANKNGVLNAFSRGYAGFTPILGGMINNSGFALGAQYLRRDLWDGNLLLRGSARISTREYEMYDAELGLPNLANKHAFVDLYARRRNYPQVSYYGPGPNSVRSGRTDYRFETMSYDVWAGLMPSSHLRLGVTSGYLQVNVGPGTDKRFASADRTYSPAQTPGILQQADFYRGGGLAHLDLRDNPYGPKKGGQYYARFDYYDDKSFSLYGFKRLTAEAQQFVPMFNKKRVIAARAKTTLSFPLAGQQVPFYLQPSLGSADDVRGFRPFRFYDNNNFVMNAEWRWEILSSVEGALFFDAGKVFPRPGELNFSGIRKSYGGGLRFRSPGTQAMILRLDVAASHEGIQLWLVFNDLFAAPQIRTGRELSPPPGRLP